MIFPAISPALASMSPRFLLAGGALAVLLASGWWYGHVRYNAGQADVQALWDADKAAATQALLAAARRADDIRRADAAISEQVQHDLQTRALAADARNADLTRRLREHEARACRSPVSGPAGPSAGTAPAGPEPGSDRGIAPAVAAVVSACESDASVLIGWQDWYRGVASHR